MPITTPTAPPRSRVKAARTGSKLSRSVKAGAKTATLSRTDWMIAGQDLLCDQGISGMRLMKLTQRLKVSTGSFYHHFVDMEDFLTQLADFYTSDRVRTLVDRVTMNHPEPKDRMREVAAESIRTGLFRLDAAMRVWAASDERAAESIRVCEVIVLNFLIKALVDAGLDPVQAELRAKILLIINVGHLLTISESEWRRIGEQTLNLMLPSLRPGSPAAGPSPAKPRAKRKPASRAVRPKASP